MDSFAVRIARQSRAAEGEVQGNPCRPLALQPDDANTGQRSTRSTHALPTLFPSTHGSGEGSAISLATGLRWGMGRTQGATIRREKGWRTSSSMSPRGPMGRARMAFIFWASA
jgi:hypothetical protein